MYDQRGGVDVGDHLTELVNCVGKRPKILQCQEDP